MEEFKNKSTATSIRSKRYGQIRKSSRQDNLRAILLVNWEMFNVQ